MALKANIVICGNRKLRIKYLRNGDDDDLDQDDTVWDYFVDRTSVNARKQDFTVHVYREPPEPTEHIHSFRDESVAPNSSARYLKRPRHSLLKDAAAEQYASSYAREGSGLTNKRQRLDYETPGGVLDKDCPLTFLERDLENSVCIVENSQRSPRTSRRFCRNQQRGRHFADTYSRG